VRDFRSRIVFNSDGKTDAVVYGGGVWYLLQNTKGYSAA